MESSEVERVENISREISVLIAQDVSLGRVASAKTGAFQITGANSNEEFSAGGSFNTRSRQKKGSEANLQGP